MAQTKYDKIFALKLDDSLVEYIDQAATARGVSRAGVVRHALLNERRRSIGGWDQGHGDVVTRKL